MTKVTRSTTQIGSTDLRVKLRQRSWAPSPLSGARSTVTPSLRTAGVSGRRRVTGASQEPRRTLRLGSGTCRDFAVLMIEAVRSLGLAARFVSGYIYVPSRDRRGAPEHHGGGNTHAWMQVYLPGAGWVEFDPTNNIVGNRDLIRVAVVRDPNHAVPLSGSWTGAAADCLGMEVSIRVTSDEGGQP